MRISCLRPAAGLMVAGCFEAFMSTVGTSSLGKHVYLINDFYRRLLVAQGRKAREALRPHGPEVFIDFWFILDGYTRRRKSLDSVCLRKIYA